MELSIIQRVAQLVSAKKTETPQGEKKEGVNRVKADTVNLSDLATEIQTVKAKIESLPEKDDSREAQVRRIKEALDRGDYQLSEHMVDSIAEKIANALI